jgi:ATP-binding cassette subfamily F protein 3
MFSVSALSVFFSGNELFSNISFMIQPSDRIGLTGKNGAGKSTLMKIIAGMQAPTSGSVDFPKEKLIAYLPQEMKLSPHRTVMEETKTVFKEIKALEIEEKQITESLHHRTDYETEDYAKTLDRLNDIHIKLDLLEADKIDMKAERILKGLGFPREEFERSLNTFSGGWQMRVELAKILLREPDLLLLDEPTNHLDIESILWLEDYLRNFRGAIMLISHDRRFLDNVTNRTIEIVFGQLYDYKASYSKYMELREERYQQQMATYRNQQKYIKQQEAFINRFKAKASKAKQAQSRMKALEKIERIEIDEFDESSIHFSFPAAPRSGEVALTIEGLRKTYHKPVLRDVNLKAMRGERLAFVGKNGMGKSTLVKCITGETEFEGLLKPGHNVQLGYYAQIQEHSLNPEKTVLETVELEATGELSKTHRLRGLLGAFLFGEEDIDKKVKVLSGGEKSRLALARLLLTPCNLLILDEPTNHLDIASKEILKEALLEYDGTLIVVSHDRDFLEGLTNRTIEFKDGNIKEHLGPIAEFLEKYKLSHFREFEMTGKKPEPEKNTAQKPTAAHTQSREVQKEKEKNNRKSAQRIKQLEQKIAQLEAEQKSLESHMAQPENYDPTKPEVQTLMYKHSELQRELSRNMEEWERLSELLEG